MSSSRHATAAAVPATVPSSAPEAHGSRPKVLWVQTTNKAVFTAAVEVGVQHFAFDASRRALAAEWATLAAIPHTMWSESDSAKGGRQTLVEGEGNGAVLSAVIGRVASRADVEGLAALAADTRIPTVIMDAADWQSIPAENLVAAFQGSPVRLMATASSAADARMKLEALEAGVGGVLLRTDDPLQVRAVASYLARLADHGAARLRYEVATVTRLQPVGMGDRVCVDLCSNMAPGEGLLVGSFARGLFLVHSECADSAYINSRPFRVNAGPVHAYTQGECGRTAYLAELASGHVVSVADAAGRVRPAVVGRVKVETRPLTLVEASSEDGATFSTLLQNAETVRLVGPAPPDAADSEGWQATSVSQLVEGRSRVLILRQSAARHTGIAIQEYITER